ncbi:MAG: AlkZ-related protein [Phocaeicola sp.]|uniref:AlkZ-related protein n=1 Tax=Phocaeicola sp. TaxID=2773926 RepID=UPI003FA14EAE|nr:hypothetical protein [Phocaeicola oris]
MKYQIYNKGNMEHLINKMGFLPFFNNEIDDFSIAEFTPKELWFSDETDGPWEWKGPVIIEGDVAYGKFYKKKAMYVSMDWFPDFMNYRRSLYKITSDEEKILDTLRKHKTLLSKELKRACGYVKPRLHRSLTPIERLVEEETKNVIKKEKICSTKESFDGAITRLQMGTYIITADFEYSYDREGNRYGWGVARYCTPEDFFGPERLIVKRTPLQSKLRMIEHLHKLLPYASDEAILSVIG